jgi:hypothetical protein
MAYLDSEPCSDRSSNSDTDNGDFSKVEGQTFLSHDINELENCDLVRAILWEHVSDDSS